jgi:nicotinate-nucleotide adenylyltransferase
MGGRRIGLLGGTFDPFHAGHLDLARACFEKLGLDQLRVLTAHVPPHKAGPHAAGIHRHAMVALAFAGDERILADPRELEREGPSYTVDTLASFQAEQPDAELFFLAGADSLRDLSSWREPQRILERAVFVAVDRDGLDLEDAAAGHAEAIAAGRIQLFQHEPPPWSSTALRAILGRGEEPPPEALHPDVARYIRKTGLYGPTLDGSSS